jgi:uncharacterized protein (DUF433 family)
VKRHKRIEFGQYIVSDPKICGGEWTFKGSRMFVKDALAMLAKGYSWGRICREFYGFINYEAIAEAIELARQTLIAQSEKQRRAS